MRRSPVAKVAAVATVAAVAARPKIQKGFSLSIRNHVDTTADTGTGTNTAATAATAATRNWSQGGNRQQWLIGEPEAVRRDREFDELNAAIWKRYIELVAAKERAA